MSIIYRCELKITDRQTIQVPSGGWFLDAHAYVKQGFDVTSSGISVWWFIPDKNAKPEPITFRIIGTGIEFDDPIDTLVPLGSVITSDPQWFSPLVWHLFEEIHD